MNLRSQLIEFEGCVPHAYEDHLGFLTIGVGRLIDKRKGGRLSSEEINLLLDNDIARLRASVAAILPWVVGLNEPRQAVILGMAFQMGVMGLLKFKNMRAAAQDGRYADAANAMLKSLWAKQTPERATRLAKQMETGEWS